MGEENLILGLISGSKSLGQEEVLEGVGVDTEGKRAGVEGCRTETFCFIGREEETERGVGEPGRSGELEMQGDHTLGQGRTIVPVILLVGYEL